MVKRKCTVVRIGNLGVRVARYLYGFWVMVDMCRYLIQAGPLRCSPVWLANWVDKCGFRPATRSC